MSRTEIHVFVVTIVVPAVVCAIAMIIAWRPWRKEAPVRAAWGGAAGFSLAYATGHVANVGGAPGLPPTLVENWLPYIALAAGMAGVGAALFRVAWWGLAGLAMVVSTAGAAAIVHDLPAVSRPWEGAGVTWLVIAGVGVLTALSVLSYDALSRRTEGGSPAWALWLALAGASYLFVALHFAKAMHLTGVLASACAVAGVLAWWRKSISVSGGAVMVCLVVYAALWVVAVLFIDGVSPWIALAAFVSPQAAWAGEAPIVRTWKPWQRTLVRLAAVGVWIGVTVALGRPAPSPYGDLYQGY